MDSALPEAPRPRRPLLAPLGAGTLVFGIVALWTFTATPRYRSTALLRIESSSTSAPFLDDLKSIPGANLMGLGSDEVETEIGVLKSRRVADAALDSLALMVQLRPTDRPRRTLLEVAVVDSSREAAAAYGELTFARAARGYVVRGTLGENDTPLTATLQPGDTLRVGAVRLRLVATGDSLPEEFTARLLPRYKAQQLLEDRLEIRTQEGGSKLVEVTYEDPDRELAAAVVQRMLDTYIDYTLGTAATDDSRRVTELRREVAAYAGRLATAEEALRRFKEQRRLVVPDEQATAQLKRIGEAQVAIDELEVERAALTKLLELVNRRARGGLEPAAFRQLATFPSLITNRAIQDMLASMIELETKRSELQVRRTPGNDEVAEMTRRIGELETQLQRTGSQYLEALDQQLGVATQSLKAMTADLDAFPRQEMEFVRLYRDRTLLSEGYAMLQKQLKQMELQAAMKADRIHVVDPPRVADADNPAFPRVTVQLALGAVLSIASALLVAFGRALLASASATGSQASTTASQKVGSASAA
jgi:uncharacterized protein involved in exopolysaccharide biosynthesis